jgi:Domain of unknown function (DUF4350)
MTAPTVTPATDASGPHSRDPDALDDLASPGALAPQVPGDRRARRRKTIGWSIAIAIGVLLTAGQLVQPAFDNSPVQGPKGSSHSTNGSGVAALAELASGFGYTVVRYDHPLTDIGPFAKHPIDENATLVILDAAIGPKDLAAVESFVRRGGTLVANVNDPADWLAEIPELTDYVASYSGEPKFPFGRADDVQSQSVEARGTVGAREPFALRVLAGSHFALAVDPTTADVTPVVRQGEDTTAIRATVTDGNVVAFTDASMLSNDLLDQGDNAAFALAVLGPTSGPVVFAEEPHGYRAATDASGLPSNVRWFLGGLLIATLILMWSRSRRNGPPEYPARELAPARSQYLHSLASEIDRVHQPRGLARLRRRPSTLQNNNDPVRSEETSTND